MTGRNVAILPVCQAGVPIWTTAGMERREMRAGYGFTWGIMMHTKVTAV